MIIQKQIIVDELRRRGLAMRADFVNKQLPDEVNTDTHGGLLSTLNVNAAEMAALATAQTGEDRGAA